MRNFARMGEGTGWRRILNTNNFKIYYLESVLAKRKRVIYQEMCSSSLLSVGPSTSALDFTYYCIFLIPLFICFLSKPQTLICYIKVHVAYIVIVEQEIFFVFTWPLAITKDLLGNLTWFHERHFKCIRAITR
jgi:hypothetical protein